MAWPDANIEAAAERCLIYLIGTRDLGLHYDANALGQHVGAPAGLGR